MTNRDDFLQRIWQAPESDDERLVYADWLQEYGDGDRDRATEEFIRRTCENNGLDTRKAIKPMDAKWLAKNWLGDRVINKHGAISPAFTENWCRLCPALVRWLKIINQTGGQEVIGGIPTGYPRATWKRDGRRIELTFFTSQLHIKQIVTLEFWRGFVKSITCSYWAQMDNLLPLLMIDQPCVVPQIASLERDFHGGRDWARVYEGQIGPYAMREIELLHREKTSSWRPDRYCPAGDRVASAHWDRAQEDVHKRDRSPVARMMDAVTWALREAAKDCLTPTQRDGAVEKIGWRIPERWIIQNIPGDNNAGIELEETQPYTGRAFQGQVFDPDFPQPSEA
jgi:uncharacterized protein (TIGR02996 family)